MPCCFSVLILMTAGCGYTWGGTGLGPSAGRVVLIRPGQDRSLDADAGLVWEAAVTREAVRRGWTDTAGQALELDPVVLSVEAIPVGIGIPHRVDLWRLHVRVALESHSVGGASAGRRAEVTVDETYRGNQAIEAVLAARRQALERALERAAGEAVEILSRE